MDISRFTAEDFILDPAFKKWILESDASSNRTWEDLLEKYPQKVKEVDKARELLLSISMDDHHLESEEKTKIWRRIGNDIKNSGTLDNKEKVLPLNAISTIAQRKNEEKKYPKGFIKAVATISALLLVSWAWWAINNENAESLSVQESGSWVERVAPPGVKTQLSLSDGTVVLLNSGSKIRYPKFFGKENRRVELEGEAFFDVKPDPNKPFTVLADKTETVVLGTTFNIKAFPGEAFKVSLLSGKVKVGLPGKEEVQQFILSPGEELDISPVSWSANVEKFNEDLVIGWTKKLLVFQETPWQEAIRILENWYGVEIDIVNRPERTVKFNGKFQNETLKRVLEGLGYASGFNYVIEKEKVKIKFNP